MIKFISVLILNFTFLIVNCFAQSWHVVDPTTIAGTPDFSDLFFTDETTGWISSSSQANIYKTADGGVSFSTQVTSFGINAIDMIDGSNGYSGGTSGFVYSTGDGGLNWHFFGTMATTLTDIDFATLTQGYACGNGGAVFSVNATGVTNLNSGSASDFGGISAPTVNNVWVCGGNRVYYYNGTDFTGQIPPTGTFNDIHFINNQEGWVVGNGGVIGRTTDGGALWVEQTNPDPQNLSLYGVFFLDSNNGWAVGNGGIILHTIDGGTTWSVEGVGLTTAFLRGVQFTSPTNGYVVGNLKTLIKYGTPLATEDENGLPTEFSLSQNYPNPFNPSTTIKYTVSPAVIATPHLLRGKQSQEITSSSQRTGSPRNDNVVLNIYNILGNEVATLVDEVQPPGEYSVKFNIRTDLESVPTNGIYFYKLQVGDEVETKKMLLMK